MYGIFNSSSGEFLGFCEDRKEADFYVANENLKNDYAQYYVKKIEPLSTFSGYSIDDVKRYYNIAYSFPLVSMDTDIVKTSFSISDLHNVSKEDNYIPYFGDDKKVYMRCFSSCISVNVTASNYEEAVSKSILELVNVLGCKKNEELSVGYIFDKINNTYEFSL